MFVAKELSSCCPTDDAAQLLPSPRNRPDVSLVASAPERLSVISRDTFVADGTVPYEASEALEASAGRFVSAAACGASVACPLCEVGSPGVLSLATCSGRDSRGARKGRR